MQVFVECEPDCAPKTVEVEPTDKVETILTKIERKHSLLTLGTKTLDRSSSVSKCGIRPCAVLQLDRRLHGGMQKTVRFVYSFPMTGLMSHHPVYD